MKVTRTCHKPPEDPGHTLHDYLVLHPIMGLRKAKGCVGPSPGYFLSTMPCTWHMAQAQQILTCDTNELILQSEKQVRIRGKLVAQDNYETLQKVLSEASCTDGTCSVVKQLLRMHVVLGSIPRHSLPPPKKQTSS